MRDPIKQREWQRKYEQTAKGKATKKRHNDKRYWIHRDRPAHAASAEEAQQIRAHINRRKREFIARQSARAEAESV